jgi:hypothetical protein
LFYRIGPTYQIVIEAVVFIDQPLSSRGHDDLHVLVKHLAVDDAQEQLGPVVGLLRWLVVGLVLRWGRLLEALDDALATPEALVELVGVEDRNGRVLRSI